MSSERTDQGIFLESRPLRLRLRSQGYVDQRAFRINGTKNRVADPADAEFGLGREQKRTADELATARSIKGDRKFCLVRERPLLILHLLALGEDRDGSVNLVDPVVTLSVCLPKTALLPMERSYQVNQVFREAQLRASREDVDDDEDPGDHVN